MRLTVDIPLRSLAVITEHRGNRIERERYAVPGPGARWTFDDSGRAVDERVQAAIDTALRQARTTATAD